MPEIKVNKAQTLAIQHASGPMQVLAGPGSGKTYLIVRRIRHLIRHHGVSPGHILVITFTKAAAEEMKSRFIKLTQGRYSEVCFGTFHGVYFQILKQSGYSDFKLASMKEKQSLLTHILHAGGACREEEPEFVEKLLKAISSAKNIGSYEKGEMLSPQFEDIYREYCRIMKEGRRIDFDDMILLCDELLTERKKVLSHWQKIFSYILVDEFQDISCLQYQVLRRLALPDNNLFVVGDDDQSVYGFRGAGPEIMRRFMTDYPEAAQLPLDINYRCSGAIVEAANRVISENENRFIKKLTADHKQGRQVLIRNFEKKEEEQSYLAGELLGKSMEELCQTAVIFRTNAEAEDFAGLMEISRIPFCIHGRQPDLFHTQEAADILSYLSFASEYYNNPLKGGRRTDFLRIMNKPLRYIPRDIVPEQVTWSGLLESCKDRPYLQGVINSLLEDMKKIARLRPRLAIDYVRHISGYEGYLLKEKSKEEYERSRRILQALQGMAGDCRTFREWKEEIEEYRKRTDIKQTVQEDKKGVSLLTMHGSKGLEYKNVYLEGIREGQVPNKKAVLAGQIEEERRLFYVAMTRAKEQLEILYWGAPSLFLEVLKKG